MAEKGKKQRGTALADKLEARRVKPEDVNLNDIDPRFRDSIRTNKTKKKRTK